MHLRVSFCPSVPSQGQQFFNLNESTSFRVFVVFIEKYTGHSSSE